MVKEISILRFSDDKLDNEYYDNGYLFPIFTSIVPDIQVNYNITYFTVFDTLNNELKIWEAEKGVYKCSVNIYSLHDFDISVMTDRLILGHIIADAREYTLDFVNQRLDDCKDYIVKHPTEFGSKYPTIEYLLKKLDRIKKDPVINIDECYVRRGFR